MKIVFSWDDGALEDQKMFELHEKYQLPGMFFVPTRNREGRDVITAMQIKNAESNFVSFGGHTHNHTFLTDIPLTDVEMEILENKKYLENIVGHEIRHFCLPGGKYNDEILNITSKYFKTIRTADTMNFSYSGMVVKPSFHFFPRGKKSLIGNSVKHFSFNEMFYVMNHYNTDYFDLINKMIINDKERDNKVIVIWGHSWEIEQKQLWDELDSLFRVVKQSGKCVEYDELIQLK